MLHTNGTASEPIIGIISGMGPHAGLDLAHKILDLTPVRQDQDHLPVAVLSYPHWIPDRSTFLFDPSEPTPVPALVAIARRLEAAGATVAGMPCNTAHAPAIFDAMVEQLQHEGSKLRMVHMIQEAVTYTKDLMPDVQRIGVLGSLAVFRLGLYRQRIEQAGLQAVLVDEEMQVNKVNRTIFDPDFGIKAHAAPVTDQARQYLLDAIVHLRDKGADAIFLGCTEFPLAIPETHFEDIPLIDPTLVLARALIRETYPERLRDAEALMHR